MKLDMKELKTITVLYVEDDNTIREQMVPVIEKLFKKLFVANDGEKGLEIYKLNQTNIDIIVTDINMPNMNGLEMISEINKINNSIPIIVTTAHTDSDFLLEAIDKNVDKYMPKPIQIKELTVNIVNEVMKYRRLNNIESLAKNLIQKSNKDEDITKNLISKLEIIKKQNSSYKIIIDNLVVNFQTDKNGIIEEVSNKFCQLFGYKNEEIIGQSINNIKCESCTQETFQKMMLKAIHTRKPVVSKYTFTKKDEQSIICEVTMTAKYNIESLVEGYIFYLDIL